MVDWYFLLEKGKAKGPFEKDQMLEAFNKGSLGPLDLIYKKGQKTWLPAFEHKDFRSLFEDFMSENVEVKPLKRWVILQKKQREDGRGFRQLGPFSSEDVLRRIHSGEFSYQDYAWASGLKKWTRIEKLEEFNPKAPAVKLGTIRPEDAVDKKLFSSPINKVSKESIYEPQVDVPPPEAITKDLTRPWDPDVEINIQVDDESSVEIQTSPVKNQKPKVSKPEVKSPPPLPVEDDHEASVWVFRLIVFGLSVGLVTIVLIVSSTPKGSAWSEFKYKFRSLVLAVLPSTSKSPAPEPQVSQPPETISPPAARLSETKVSQVPTPTPAPEPKVPTRIASKLVSGDILEIQTDGSHHFPVRVRLFGQVGKIYAKSGVYKEALIRWKANESPQLNLRSLKLAKGDYVVWLTQNEMEKIQGLRVDDLGGSHFTKLADAKKWQAIDFNLERRDLILLSADYSDLAKELERSAARFSNNLSGWRRFYSAWVKKKLGAERRRGVGSLNQLASRQLPWSWFQLSSAVDRLNDKSKAYNKAINEGSFASKSLASDDVIKSFEELRRDVVATKLF